MIVHWDFIFLPFHEKKKHEEIFIVVHWNSLLRKVNKFKLDLSLYKKCKKKCAELCIGTLFLTRKNEEILINLHWDSLIYNKSLIIMY